MKNIKALTDLQPDPNNANEGTLRGMQLLDHSVEAHGAGRGIVVDKNGLVIAGNKTLERAVERGLAVKVVRTNGDTLVVVQRADLDLKAQPAARELAYLDNRAAELGLKWSPEQLERDLERGISLGAMFTPEELSALLAREDVPSGWAPTLSPREQALTATLLFDEPAQFTQFQAFLAVLETQFPEEASIAARLARWADAQELPDATPADDAPVAEEP